MKSSLVYTIALLCCIAAGSAQAMEQFCVELELNVDFAELQKLCEENKSLVPLVETEEPNLIGRLIEAAIKNKKRDRAKYLIKTFGASIKLEDYVCVAAKHDSEMLQYLVEQLQKNNPENWQQALGSFFANFSGPLYTIKGDSCLLMDQLIKIGADINALQPGLKEGVFTTALHHAVGSALTSDEALSKAHDIPIIQFLLTHNARTDIKDSKNKTVFDLCDSYAEQHGTTPNYYKVRALLAPKKEIADALPMMSMDLIGMIAEYY